MLCFGQCVNDAILFNNCITLINLKQPNFTMLQNGKINEILMSKTFAEKVIDFNRNLHYSDKLREGF